MDNVYNEGLYLTKTLPNSKFTSDDFLDIENSRFLYARGFLVCKKNDFPITSYFKCRKLYNDYFLYFHSQLDVAQAECGDASVTILGLSYFVGDENVNHEKEEIILARKLNKSFDDFYESLDFLAGRYAIIFKKDEKIFALTDPSGLKNIYFCKGKSCFASHVELLNSYAKNKISKYEKHSQKMGYNYCYAYPANLTEYEDIVSLIPDFVLSLENYESERFYPRKPLEKTLSMYEIRNKYYDYMKQSMQELLRKNKRICMSLTGGKDSRVTAYTTIDFKDKIFYFTESRDDDVRQAAKVAKKNDFAWTGCSIKDFHFEDNRFKENFHKILRKNAFPQNVQGALQTQFWTLNMFGAGDDWIHIHSNCAEAGRGRATVYEFTHFSDEFSFEKFFSDYRITTYHWESEEFQKKQDKKMCKDRFLDSVLKKYYEKLNLDSVVELGYNPWDLLYLEQRVSCFLSAIHVLNDAVLDSVSLTNCRCIFELMWNVPEKWINNSSLLYKCIINEFENPEISYEEKKCSDLNKNWHIITSGAAACLHTARCDLKIENPEIEKSDCEIEILDDMTETVKITTPQWFAKDGTGYVVESPKYKLNMKIKAKNDGMFKLWLRAKDVREKVDKCMGGGIRIPIFIDYENLEINGKRLLEKSTPCSHDKPFKYEMKVRKGKEIRIKLQWNVHKYADVEGEEIMRKIMER